MPHFTVLKLNLSKRFPYYISVCPFISHVHLMHRYPIFSPLSLSFSPLSLSFSPLVPVIQSPCPCHSVPLSLSFSPPVPVIQSPCPCHSVTLSLSWIWIRISRVSIFHYKKAYLKPWIALSVTGFSEVFNLRPIINSRPSSSSIYSPKPVFVNTKRHFSLHLSSSFLVWHSHMHINVHKIFPVFVNSVFLVHNRFLKWCPFTHTFFLITALSSYASQNNLINVKGTLLILEKWTYPLPHLLNHFQIPTYHQLVICIENPMVIAWDFAIKHHRRTNWVISVRYKYFLCNRNFFLQPKIKQSVSKTHKTGKTIILRQLIPVCAQYNRRDNVWLHTTVFLFHKTAACCGYRL
jgi:hypothetical protein